MSQDGNFEVRTITYRDRSRQAFVIPFSRSKVFLRAGVGLFFVGLAIWMITAGLGFTLLNLLIVIWGTVFGLSALAAAIRKPYLALLPDGLYFQWAFSWQVPWDVMTDVHAKEWGFLYSYVGIDVSDRSAVEQTPLSAISNRLNSVLGVDADLSIPGLSLLPPGDRVERIVSHFLENPRERTILGRVQHPQEVLGRLEAPEKKPQPTEKILERLYERDLLTDDEYLAKQAELDQHQPAPTDEELSEAEQLELLSQLHESGILSTEEFEAKTQEVTSEVDSRQVSMTDSNQEDGLATRLERLQHLYDEGLLSSEEYNRTRERLLRDHQ